MTGGTLEGVTGSGISNCLRARYLRRSGSDGDGPHRYLVKRGPADDATIAGTVAGTSGTAIQFGGGERTSCFGPKGGSTARSSPGAGTDKFALGGLLQTNKGRSTSARSARREVPGLRAVRETNCSTWTLTGNGNQNWAILRHPSGRHQSLQGNLTLSGGNLVFD